MRSEADGASTRVGYVAPYVSGGCDRLRRHAEQAIVIGHDWGAAITYGTALFYPERVRALAGLGVPHLGRGPMPLVLTGAYLRGCGR